MKFSMKVLDPSGAKALPEDGDIYRGSDHLVSDSRPHSPAPFSVASSSSSSSASTRLVRRALAALVELAISRWARSASDASSSTSSSPSRASSIVSTSPRRRRRLYRRTSTVTSNYTITPAQRALAHEALERSRRVPREFTLLLPVPPNSKPDRVSPQRAMCSSSLPIVLSQLGNALTESARSRKEKQRPRLIRGHAEHDPQVPSGSSGGATLGEGVGIASSPRVAVTASTPLRMFTSPQSPKARLSRPHIRPSIGTIAAADGGFAMGQKAWWLDVASPTWEDMRAIGTVSG